MEMKFEVGDIVKVINENNPFCDKVKVGDLGKIIDVEDGVIDILFGDIEQTLFIRSGWDCLELVGRPIEVPKITPLSISDGFMSFMLGEKYEKEKEKVKTGFTIRRINDVDKIIFNAPATIVYMQDGSRYVTKAYNEDFDKEKGLALALLKAFGISYLDLQRLIKGATVQEKKAPKKVNVADVTVEGQSIIGEKTVAEKPKNKRTGRQEETVEVEYANQRVKIHTGKRRGVGQKLQQGDEVFLRLCKVYDWEEMETIQSFRLIGQPMRVEYVGENTVKVSILEPDPEHPMDSVRWSKRLFEFSRNEVDRI